MREFSHGPEDPQGSMLSLRGRHGRELSGTDGGPPLHPPLLEACHHSEGEAINETPTLGFNYLLELIGGVGRFQVIFVILLLLSMTLTACQVFLQNFTAQVVEHHCRLPLHSNQSHWANHTHMEILRVFIPFRANRQPNRCLRFTMPHWELLRTNDTEKNDTEASLEPCLDGWTYNTSIFSSTIISEWDLVCDQKGLRDMAQSVLMAGVLIGAVVFGYLADRFGRRALLIWSYLQMGIAGTCVAFLPTFSCYCIFRFLTGMAISGVQLNTISLILEWMPPKGRTLAVCLPGHGFPLGQLLLAGVAYAIRDWRWLQFAITLPIFLFFFCSW